MPVVRINKPQVNKNRTTPQQQLIIIQQQTDIIPFRWLSSVNTNKSRESKSFCISSLLFTLELTPHPSDRVFIIGLVVVSNYRTTEQWQLSLPNGNYSPLILSLRVSLNPIIPWGKFNVKILSCCWCTLISNQVLKAIRAQGDKMRWKWRHDSNLKLLTWNLSVFLNGS